LRADDILRHSAVYRCSFGTNKETSVVGLVDRSTLTVRWSSMVRPIHRLAYFTPFTAIQQ